MRAIMSHPLLGPKLDATANILSHVVLFKPVLLSDTLTVFLKLLKKVSMGAHLKAKQRGLTELR